MTFNHRGCRGRSFELRLRKLRVAVVSRSTDYASGPIRVLIVEASSFGSGSMLSAVLRASPELRLCGARAVREWRASADREANAHPRSAGSERWQIGSEGEHAQRKTSRVYAGSAEHPKALCPARHPRRQSSSDRRAPPEEGEEKRPKKEKEFAWMDSGDEEDAPEPPAAKSRSSRSSPAVAREVPLDKATAVCGGRIISAVLVDELPHRAMLLSFLSPCQRAQ